MGASIPYSICVFFCERDEFFKSGVKNRGNDANSEDGTCEAVMQKDKHGRTKVTTSDEERVSHGLNRDGDVV